MRKIITLLMAVIFTVSAFAQENDTTKVDVGKKNIVTVTDGDNGTSVNVLEDEVIVDVRENEDTVKIKIGNKGISIIETDHGTNVEIIELEDFEKHGWRKNDRFKGHWAGYELGLNNYLTSDFKFAGSDPENLFLDLNTGKSWNANINFIQYSLPMGRSIGWTTGMGFEWNNYYFDGNNSIGKDSIGNIGPVYPPNGAVYSKSKMNTTYLTLPLLLEFQLGKKKKGFISFGVIGGLKLHSNVKTKYDLSGSKEKNKVKDDLNLNPLRYSVTVRAGYKFIKVYANYGMMPLFQDNRGPEVYPFNVGLILLSFR